MQIGLALPHYDFSFPDGGRATVARVLEYAARAESLGFDSVWVSDHLFLDLSRYGGPSTRYGTPEAMAMLGAIAAATTRVRFGSLVLCAPFRNPRVLAAQARAIHEASEGRLELGIGSGWYEPEFAEAGIPFGSAAERRRHMREAIVTLREHLADGPRIWVGSKGGPLGLRAVADLADGWNVVWAITPEQYEQRLALLRRACVRANREPAAVALSVGLSTLLATDEDDLTKRYERLQGWTPGGALDGTTAEQFADGRLVGTAERCAGLLRRFEDMGVGEVILSFAGLPFSVFEDEQLELAASELLPRVRR